MQGNNWVKCSDSLPPEDIIVIVYAKAEDGEDEIGIAWREDTSRTFIFYDDGKTQLKCRPTHWMECPLPPMPEGE
ncbi:DUF551 domain-containing protein [Providencia sp. VP23HZSY-1]|uniref:DUF551 domain-containing protein n=1 Tax=Providencia sp. VP23HZSY-1 TaxID=3391806 RepID=UPI003AF62BAB